MFVTDRTSSESAAPVLTGERNTNLDMLRGVAVMGILLMNAVSFGLSDGAYHNLSDDGMATILDWIVGIAGEILVDQKFMGIFSALFGAGIVLFADRVETKGGRPVLLSLWRNFLLLTIGLVHAFIWDGDILVEYALASPVVIALRKAKPKMLFIIGTVIFLLSPLSAWYTQSTIGEDGRGLGGFWGTGIWVSDAVEIHLLVDVFARTIGMMLIGVGLYRIGFITGERTRATYIRAAKWGLVTGLPLATLSIILFAADDFSGSIALRGSIPNSLATIPIVIAYISLITLWNSRSETGVVLRLRAAGRMALTNYLTQSVIGVLTLTILLAEVNLTRTLIAAFVVTVWAIQLAWSKPWLERFHYGPMEWLWRCATYRTWVPLRRTT